MRAMGGRNLLNAAERHFTELVGRGSGARSRRAVPSPLGLPLEGLQGAGQPLGFASAIGDCRYDTKARSDECDGAGTGNGASARRRCGLASRGDGGHAVLQPMSKIQPCAPSFSMCTSQR
jgi:hypothetical protein